MNEQNKRPIGLTSSYNNSLTISCNLCLTRCSAGLLRDAPCDPRLEEHGEDMTDETETNSNTNSHHVAN